MDQYGTDMELDRSINAYSRKKELFYCTIKFKKNFDEVLLIKSMILLNKFYPGYEIYDDSDINEVLLNWQELVLKRTFTFDKEGLKTFYVAAPFYIQNDNEVMICKVRDGITFSIGWDDKGNCFDFIFNLYADVITNKVYFYESGKYIEKDQSKAAKKNREILCDFLKALEDFLEGEIIESISDNYLAPDSVYKYGIKENARHITDHMNF